VSDLDRPTRAEAEADARDNPFPLSIHSYVSRVERDDDWTGWSWTCRGYSMLTPTKRVADALVAIAEDTDLADLNLILTGLAKLVAEKAIKQEFLPVEDMPDHEYSDEDPYDPF